MLSRRALFKSTLAACACGLQHKSFGMEIIRIEDDDVADDDDLPTGGCLLMPDRSDGLLPVDEIFEAQSAFATGNSQLDHQLGVALVRATQFFGINPAFGFYKDMNAQASPTVSEKFKGTWGTVLFGTPLFNDEIKNRDPSGMTIVAIVAHEFGHIIQFKKNLKNQILANQGTVKRLELHADILAGYYIGSMKRQHPGLKVYSAGEVFHRIGDSHFTSPNHHGTPEERKTASQFGFEYGKNGNMTLDQIVGAGMNFVSQM